MSEMFGFSPMVAWLAGWQWPSGDDDAQYPVAPNRKRPIQEIEDKDNATSTPAAGHTSAEAPQSPFNDFGAFMGWNGRFNPATADIEFPARSEYATFRRNIVKADGSSSNLDEVVASALAASPVITRFDRIPSSLGGGRSRERRRS